MFGTAQILERLQFVPLFILALSVHEWAHAYMAFRLGDNTAKLAGRLTLNPLAHIDPIGTVLIPLIQIFGSGIPLIGSRYYQEIAPGVAMDRAETVSVTETVETPAGKFEKVLKSLESTPLESGKEYKLYAPGVGLIQDANLKLVKVGKK